MKTKLKYKVIELPEMVGKTLREVHEYLKEKYPNQLPTAKDREAFEKEGHELPNWTWCYFFGDIDEVRDGSWCVPCSGWGSGEWDRYASRLGLGWRSVDRVVLLEIANGPETLASGTGPLAEPLALRQAIEICKAAGLSVMKIL